MVKNEIADKNFVPKVSFEIAKVKPEADLFYEFITEEGNKRWRDTFSNLFPELVKELDISKNKKIAIKKCESSAKQLHIKNKKKILKNKKIFETRWKKIEAKFLLALSEVFETNWDPKKQKIIGKITVLPVFPRYLDDYSFYVGYKNISAMMETSAHEIVHFLWFKKWQEVFPEIKKKEYESPHLVWRLSEIIDPIILQCHPKIKKIIKPTSWGYSAFNKIKIDGSSVTEHFRKVYLDSIASKNDFSTTMKLLWREAQRHEKKIRTF